MSNNSTREKYSWNQDSNYLKYESRLGLWNDDYMDFLVQNVWKITDPVNIIDFGCGLGFMGYFLLPKLPERSTYTGIDIESKLLEEARSFFEKSGVQATFKEHDLFEYIPEKKYDIAISHAVLIHLPKAQTILEKMKQSVVDGGKIICVEPNWSVLHAGSFVERANPDEFSDLGKLQKDYAEEYANDEVDRRIGTKIPVYMARLGLKDVSARINDKVSIEFSENDDKYAVSQQAWTISYGTV